MGDAYDRLFIAQQKSRLGDLKTIQEDLAAANIPTPNLDGSIGVIERFVAGYEKEVTDRAKVMMAANQAAIDAELAELERTQKVPGKTRNIFRRRL